MTHLALIGLTAGYGDLAILKGIDLEVYAGQILCITGRNGVGKTTLLRAISGQIRPFAGRVVLGGADVAGLPPHRRQRLGISYAPQDDVTFGALSVRQNLTLHHHGHGLERYDALFGLFPRIRERLAQRAGSLSGGERKILSFCRVMAEGGALLCLDEPTEGVQPENIAHMALCLRQAAESGAAVVVVEQNLALVEALSAKALVIDHGEIVGQVAPGPNLRDDVQAFLRV